MLAEASERLAELEAGDRVTDPGRIDVRRRGASELIEKLAHRPDKAIEPDIGVGIRRGSVAQSLGRPRGITPQDDRGPIRRGRERADIGAHERQPMLLQVEIPMDRGSEATDGVGERRNLEMRSELHRVGRAAHPIPALEDEGLEPALGEVGSGHQRQ